MMLGVKLAGETQLGQGQEKPPLPSQSPGPHRVEREPHGAHEQLTYQRHQCHKSLGKRSQ